MSCRVAPWSRWTHKEPENPVRFVSPEGDGGLARRPVNAEAFVRQRRERRSARLEPNTRWPMTIQRFVEGCPCETRQKGTRPV